MLSFYQSLEFDLPGALTEELAKLFDDMPQGKLNAATIDEHVDSDAQGVYQLFVDTKLVYIGKTDADAGLGKRLLRHSAKVASRKNLSPALVTFKAVRVYVFTVMDLEGLLIKYYERKASSKAEVKEILAWNRSGFGSNDPGRNRDTSEVKVDHFDAPYPIDLDLKIKVPHAGVETSVATILFELKNELPYVLRFQTSAPKKKTPHPELVSATVVLKTGSTSVRNVLRQIASALGAAWQITVLPGYIILYKESVIYVHAMRL